MDAAILDQLRQRQLRDLAADAVERREHDCVRCVVDDEVDARQVLERTDVASFTANDPPLHVVGRELDDRDSRLCGVTRGDTLQRVGDEIARTPLRLDPRFFFELAHLPRELVADEVLGPLEQVLLRLVHGHARDSLELLELPLLGELLLLLQLLEVDLAVNKPLFSPHELGQLPVDLLLLREHALLDLDRPPALLRDLGLDLRPESHGLLARADLRLPAEGLRLSFRVLQELPPELSRLPDPRAPESAECDCAGCSAEDETDEYPDHDEHVGSWVGCQRGDRDRTRREPANGMSRIVKRADTSARAGGCSRAPLSDACRCRDVRGCTRFQ